MIFNINVHFWSYNERNIHIYKVGRLSVCSQTYLSYLNLFYDFTPLLFNCSTHLHTPCRPRCTLPYRHTSRRASGRYSWLLFCGSHGCSLYIHWYLNITESKLLHRKHCYIVGMIYMLNNFQDGRNTVLKWLLMQVKPSPRNPLLHLQT